MSTVVGKYELIRSLGEGATSEVYLARDTNLNRQVALKILKPSLIQDPGSFARFAQEARTAAELFHPSIATVLDMGESDGRYYIVMRYVAGPSLDKQLREHGPLSLDETTCMSQQIGDALEFAHGKGFLHRDVKPANILCDANSTYSLTDFGLTRAMMSTGLTSHTGAVLGTPAYIAPEVWLNQPASPATDQYALACVVYEALNGEALFTGDTPPAVMTSHVLHGAKIRPEALRGLPEGYRRALLRGLERNPADRYPSVRTFTKALVEQSKRNPSPGPEGPTESRRHVSKTAVIGALCAVFVFVFAVAFAMLNGGIPPRPEPGTAAPTAVGGVASDAATGSKTTGQTPKNPPGSNVEVIGGGTGEILFEALGTKSVEIIKINADGSSPVYLTDNKWADWIRSVSPDGEKIAFQTVINSNWDIQVMKKDGTNLSNLTNSSSSEVDPVWSPDGTKIAYASNQQGDYDIHIMSSDGSNPVRITMGILDELNPMWSPDGKKLTYTGSQKEVMEVYMKRIGDPTVYRVMSKVSDNIPVWSPDGKQIAYVYEEGENREILVINVDSWKPVNITNSGSNDENPTWSPDGKQIAFSSNRDGNYEIYIMNADGSNPVRVTNSSLKDQYPAWSPDGNWIVFSSQRDNRFSEVNIIKKDGTQLTRLTDRAALETHPRWVP